MRQATRRYIPLICIVTVLCLLIVMQRTSPGYPADVRNTKTLTRYTFNRNMSDLRSKHISEAIDRIHHRDFVKPEGEECKKRFPTAMIIGVNKCGTRELTEFLHLHPLVEVYSRQVTQGNVYAVRGEMGYEMDYFGRDFSSGVDWFRDQMPCSFSNQITFMKHSTYFPQADIPKRIHDFNSNMKLILMVREPVSRSIARFMYEVQTKWIKSGTALEDVILQNGTLNEGHGILKHSSYDESMKMWLKYFSLSQIMIIESDDFKHRPGEVLAKVEEFLGLPHSIKPGTFVWNEDKGYYCIKSELDQTGMACYGNERGKTLIDISPKTKAILVEYFRPKNRNFFEMIGRTFDNWNY